ncbi:hypothetical protein PTKIN_Ptkin01aG0345100 [Pterospermum kingtungense]
MDPKLYEAAASGDLNFLKRTHQANLDVFQVTKHQQNNVLHIAVKFKQVEFCKQILKSSSTSLLLTKSNSKGESALHVAAKVGCLEIVKLLVHCTKELSRDVENSRVNARSDLLRMVNKEKDTALHVAVRNGHFAVAKYLIEADQGFFDMINDANVSLLCLAIEGGFSQIANFILEKFPDSPDGEINIKTALHSAVIHSQHDTVKLLLKKVPNSRNGTDQIGWTPLHYAALYGDLKSTKLLLEGTSSTAYIVDLDGTSALHVAAFRGHINVVEQLVQHCPDIHEVTDKKGRSLLHVAVIGGHEKMVRRILEMPMLLGIINEKDNDRNTALHLAVIYKRNNIITFLAQNREMEKTLMNKNRFTAYDIFSIQPRKLSFLVAKIHYGLRGTHGLPALQEWVNTDLRREMIGETENHKDTNNLFSIGETDSSTEASDDTEKKSRLEIHLLIAMLIATVTFQASFTVPGGYKDDGPDEGTAQFIQKAAFKAFLIFNTMAFIFSIVAVYIQFATSKFSYRLRSRYASLTEVMIFVAVLGMILAFASGMYVEVANSFGLRLIAYIMVGCFLLIYYICWFVDPISMKVPGLQHPRKYLRDLLFRYGII